jgi:hypothetical protein
VSGQVQVNTQTSPISQSFSFTDPNTNTTTTPTLNLPAGPYVEVDVSIPTGTPATLGSGKIAGDLLFQQQTINGASTTLIGLNNVWIWLPTDTTNPTLKQGQGLLVIESGGIAGYVSGVAQVSGTGFSASGQILIRINTTGSAVHVTATVGGQQLTIDFGDNEGNVFDVSVTGLSLNIAGVVTLEGDVTLGSKQIGAINGSSFAGTGLKVFFGNGPATLANGDPNPLAQGLLLNNATVALFTDNTHYAFYGKGDVQLLGGGSASLSGQATFRVNTFGQGFNETFAIPGGSSSVPLSFSGTEITTFSSAASD